MVAVKAKAKIFEVPVLEEGFDQIIVIEGNDSSLLQVEGVMPVGEYPKYKDNTAWVHFCGKENPGTTNVCGRCLGVVDRPVKVKI